MYTRYIYRYIYILYIYIYLWYLVPGNIEESFWALEAFYLRIFLFFYVVWVFRCFLTFSSAPHKIWIVGWEMISYYYGGP